MLPHPFLFFVANSERLFLKYAQQNIFTLLQCIEEKLPKRWTKKKRAYIKGKKITEEQKTQYEKNQLLLKLVLSNQQTEKRQPLTI